MPRAARRCGFSSIRRSAGKSPRHWSGGREAAGAPAIAVTLDVRTPAKWETFVRLRRDDTRECGSCHGLNTYLSRKPNFTGIDLGGVSGTVVTNLTWDLIKRLRDTVKVKLVLKGILAFEDAKLATEAGIDAIVVSNHGGRVEDGVAATIDVLPEIVEAVGGRMPVLVDSGFRRGSDIVKALAHGRAGRLCRPPLSLGTGRLRPDRASSACWRSCAPRPATRWRSSARPRSRTSCRRWCGGFRGVGRGRFAGRSSQWTSPPGNSINFKTMP